MKKKITPYIQRLQDYLKIDLMYLIKGEFWLMLGKIIAMISSFLLALAWGNWIDKNIYGQYKYILSLVSIISLFSLPEMGTAVTQAVARKFEGDFLRGFKSKIKWGLLGGLSALIIAVYYGFQGNTSLLLAFLVVMIFLPLFNAFTIYSDYLTGKKLFDVQVRYESTIQVTASALMILSLFFINRYLLGLPNFVIIIFIISVYIASRTILRSIFFFRTKYKFTPNKKTDPQTISYGKHLTVATLLGDISGHLDKILLFHYLGAVQLAVFSFAVLIPDQTKTIFNHVGKLALPKFSVRPMKQIKKSFLKKLLYFVAFIAAGMAAYIVIAGWVYKTFFPQYTDAILFSRVYALSLIPLAFSVILPLLKAKRMTKEIYQLRIICPIIRIGLIFVLIPLFGIWGAIFSIIGARTFNAILYLVYFKKIEG